MFVDINYCHKKSPLFIWQGFWNQDRLQRQVEIEIIKLWVISNKVIAWLQTSIPWRLQSQTDSASWQHRHSFSIFIVEQSFYLHIALGLPNIYLHLTYTRFMASPSSLLQYLSRIFHDWIHSLLRQTRRL